jgi:recombination protein RecA
MAEEKSKLQSTIENLNKIYGTNSVISFTDESIDKKIQSISSGSLAFDHILGIGGYPIGRIIEIFGPESSGKTTVTLHLIAEAQKKFPNKKAAFIDAEHAFDPTYAENLGVNIKELLFSQPSSGEECLEIAEALIKTGEISVVIIDSVAALIPQAEVDGDFGDSKVGLQARLMSQAMRKLNSIVSNSETILFFTNQLRDKIGVMWGNPEITTGGNALKFYASQRIDIRKIEILREGEEKTSSAYGNRIKLKMVKNKVAPPFKECETIIVYGRGFDKVSEILDLGLEYNILNTAGGISYKETIIGNNYEIAYNLLSDNIELQEELIRKIKIKLGLIELTTEERELLEKEEKEEKWKLFEERIVKIVEKYKIDAEKWIKKIKIDFDYKTYKAYTDYQISQLIKKFNLENNNGE